jgi:hypothetical protein
LKSLPAAGNSPEVLDRLFFVRSKAARQCLVDRRGLKLTIIHMARTCAAARGDELSLDALANP